MSDLPSAGAGTEVRRRAAAQVLVEPETLSPGAAVTLTDEIEHHLRRVVRLGDGAPVSVTDGEGHWLLARVVHQRGGLVLEPDSELAVEPPPDALVVATAVPKGDRVDWLVQKATELGVARVLLLDCQRSVVRWTPERAAKQRGRLQRIADEALRQSRRVWRMPVEGPVDASAVLPEAVIAEPGGRALAASDATVAIGPEGGWTDGELARAADRVDLGDQVLRTETAAVAASALAAAVRRRKA